MTDLLARTPDGVQVQVEYTDGTTITGVLQTHGNSRYVGDWAMAYIVYDGKVRQWVRHVSVERAGDAA
ncbi:hypothetical protein GCM10027298_22050 [Epidermidibacterium keratini]